MNPKGASALSFQVQQFRLAGNQSLTVNTAFQRVRVLQPTQDNTILAQIGMRRDSVPMNIGLEYGVNDQELAQGVFINGLTLINPTASSSLIITLAFCWGKISGSRVYIENSPLQISPNLYQFYGSLTIPVDNNPTILTRSSNRANIYNYGTTNLFIGDAAVTINNFYIKPNDRLTLDNITWEVYGIRAGAIAEDVGVLEEIY